MHFLVDWVSFLHHLRSTSEYILEETPVRVAAQEIFAHGDESSKIQDSVWGEMMDLSSEKVQNPPKERVRRQRQPALDVGGEENALTIALMWLKLLPRQSPRPGFD